jgi:hypothetical protein
MNCKLIVDVGCRTEFRLSPKKKPDARAYVQLLFDAW